MTEFSPREIVSELDRFIVGHDEAKRAVAVALRNRWRRKRVPEDLRDEVTPKNILMIGSTGVGKTQIVRDLVEAAIGMVRERRRAGVRARAEGQAEDRLVDALVGANSSPATKEA